MEVVYSAEELVEESTESWGGNWSSDGLGVVVDYLLDVSGPKARCRCGGLYAALCWIGGSFRCEACGSLGNVVHWGVVKWKWVTYQEIMFGVLEYHVD
jgi:hypothetical protein